MGCVSLIALPRIPTVNRSQFASFVPCIPATLRSISSREHLTCQLISCLWTIGSLQRHTTLRSILDFSQFGWWQVYRVEFHCSLMGKMQSSPPPPVVGLPVCFLSADHVSRGVAVDGAVCYNLWLHKLCMCSLSPHVSQPNNKSRVSILGLFHIVLDMSSSETSRISTKDVYHLSMDTLDQSSCRHSRWERRVLWLVFTCPFWFVSVGIACHENIFLHRCYLLQPCAERFQPHIVVSVLSRVRQPFCFHVQWQFSSCTTEDTFWLQITNIVHLRQNLYTTWNYSWVFDQCYRVVRFHWWKGVNSSQQCVNHNLRSPKVRNQGIPSNFIHVSSVA